MRLKALLLGSATAIAVAGGAQAADLSVAEPVDYVKVCDAFGTGYWYLPGTDTCIKISGWVDFRINGGDNTYGLWEDHYDFNSRAWLSFSFKSMTDWGPLEGFISVWESTGAGGYGNIYMDDTYVSIGPLTVGSLQTGFSQWNTGDAGIADLFYGDANESGWYKGDNHTDLVRLNWAVNGFGILVELDEPDYAFDGEYRDYYGSSMPDIIAAITASTGMFDGKVSFVYSDFTGGWAVSAGVVIKLDSLAPGDKLLLQAAYGDSAPIYVLGFGGSPYAPKGNLAQSLLTGTTWSAGGAFQHFFAPNFYASAAVFYGNWDFFGSNSQWQAGFNVGYSPAPNLWIVPGVYWMSDVDHNANVPPVDKSYWQAGVRIRRNF
jgi:hypothetical protein